MKERTTSPELREARLDSIGPRHSLVLDLEEHIRVVEIKYYSTLLYFRSLVFGRRRLAEISHVSETAFSHATIKLAKLCCVTGYE